MEDFAAAGRYSPAEMLRYPYGQLARVEASSLPWIRRLARSGFDTATFSEVLGDLAGCPVALGESSFRSYEHAELTGALTGSRVCVALIGDALEARVAVELSPPIAASLVDRALGGDGTAPAGALSDGQRGVVAFLASEALSRLKMPFRVATVLTTTESILAFLGPAGVGTWMIRAQVGERAGTLRAWIPAGSTLQLTPSTPRNLAVTFVHDLAEAEVSGETLRGLHLDDVFLFDQAEGWGELARVRALRSTRTTWWVRSGVIETIEEGTSAPSARGEVMDKPVDTEATRGAQPGTVTANANYEADTRRIAEGLSAVGDAPLQVSLEVARFTLSLDEVARLAPGEVVSAGVQVGDEVRLRAGDRVLAVGDLVDIDGQIGVRIRRLP